MHNNYHYYLSAHTNLAVELDDVTVTEKQQNGEYLPEKDSKDPLQTEIIVTQNGKDEKSLNFDEIQ